MEKNKINHIISLVCRAVGLAMGIAVLVLSILGNIETSTAITLLAIGVSCLGVAQLQNTKD